MRWVDGLSSLEMDARSSGCTRVRNLSPVRRKHLEVRTSISSKISPLLAPRAGVLLRGPSGMHRDFGRNRKKN